MSLALAGAACAPARPPNIVLILADDLGYGDVGAYGAQLVATPHIDSLAAGGTRFANAYAPASVCSPSRYALMSGRYQWRTPRAEQTADVLESDAPLQLATDGTALPALLRDHGYRTAGVGKWHLGLGTAPHADWSRPLVPGPLETGFDSFFGLAANAENEPALWLRDHAAEPGPEGAPRRAVDVGPRLADEAVAFLDSVPSEPFFLYYAPTEPHIPIVPAPPFQGRSRAGPYGDFVEQLDDHVGRILGALERRGLRNRTLVLFTSDNGGLREIPGQPQPHTAAHREAEARGHRINGGLRGGKHSIWEGGVRVPLIACWPGHVPAGQTREDLVSLVDFLATFTSLLGVRPPPGAGRDGTDVLPALLGRGSGEALARPIVLQSAQGIFAIREGRWKWIQRRDDLPPPYTHNAWLLKPDNPQNRSQLYDLLDDPAEERERRSRESDTARQLSERLAEIRRGEPR